jgi:hypothetical protein
MYITREKSLCIKKQLLIINHHTAYEPRVNFEVCIN